MIKNANCQLFAKSLSDGSVAGAEGPFPAEAGPGEKGVKA
jgi:hypothetical protein